MKTIILWIHSLYRPGQEKINSQSKEKLLILQKIWLLIVLGRFLTLLILILNYYLKRL